MTLTRPWYLHIDHRIDGCYPSKQGGRMNGNQSESFIIVGGTILIFGSFVLYAVLHHDKHQNHPR